MGLYNIGELSVKNKEGTIDATYIILLIPCILLLCQTLVSTLTTVQHQPPLSDCTPSDIINFQPSSLQSVWLWRSPCTCKILSHYKHYMPFNYESQCSSWQDLPCAALGAYACWVTGNLIFSILTLTTQDPFMTSIHRVCLSQLCRRAVGFITMLRYHFKGNQTNLYSSTAHSLDQPPVNSVPSNPNQTSGGFSFTQPHRIIEFQPSPSSFVYNIDWYPCFRPPLSHKR